jgi:hypothetical protein
MQIAHAKTGLRISLTKEDHKLLSNNYKQDHVWVEFSSKSKDRFLTLSPKEFPNGNSIKFYDNNNKDHPFFMMLTGKRWTGLNDLPMFSPESTNVTPTNTHDGVLYFVHKPPMERAPNAGRKIAVFKKANKDQKIDDAKETIALNSGGLPKVEPQYLAPISNHEAKMLSLRQAIDIVNHAKDDFGDELKLEININGKLVMMLIYGG